MAELDELDGRLRDAFAGYLGNGIGRLAGGARVFTTQRSEDLLWVGVRDPGSVGSTVWVRLGDVALDDGMTALEALPVGGACPVALVSTPIRVEVGGCGCARAPRRPAPELLRRRRSRHPLGSLGCGRRGGRDGARDGDAGIRYVRVRHDDARVPDPLRDRGHHVRRRGAAPREAVNRLSACTPRESRAAGPGRPRRTRAG